MLISIKPVSKPRLTQRDRWAKRAPVLRYFAFCDELRLKYTTPLPDQLRIIFYIPMPPSWSNKKRQAFCDMPHQQKPDIDNLSKAVMDALCKDDARIYDLHATKYWATSGAIEIGMI